MFALNCPVCRAPFKEIVKHGKAWQKAKADIVKHGVLIDVCTECRGVWLDRGELDKLLDSARSRCEDQVTQSADKGTCYAVSSKKIN